jgi:transcriptional regulator with XRE-family HTH domain
MGAADDAARQINKRVGEAITQARTRAGLTQAQLGAAVGREQGTVSDWEKGNTSIAAATLVAIEEVTVSGRGRLFIAAGLVPLSDDLIDRVQLDDTIADVYKAPIGDLIRAGRRQLAGQRAD